MHARSELSTISMLFLVSNLQWTSSQPARLKQMPIWSNYGKRGASTGTNYEIPLLYQVSTKLSTCASTSRGAPCVILTLGSLSDQLYKASTHFILELIQNADDNSYASGIVPSLHLSVYDNNGQKFFRSDCNEIGFTLKQLDALALVGQSTKSAAVDNSNRYIGEKGIGFKSVFKVANVVHIASGFYEFKFDRNGQIGMILPILSSFPIADRVLDHTQFLLELKDASDYFDLRGELKSIEPDLLLFLRNLGQIRISTHSTSRLCRREITKFDSRYGGETVKISSRGDTVTHKTYVVHRHTAERLPPDSRRAGVTSSEVIIAFKFEDEVIPSATTQTVFAFLPIDNFGFRVSVCPRGD